MQPRALNPRLNPAALIGDECALRRLQVPTEPPNMPSIARDGWRHAGLKRVLSHVTNFLSSELADFGKNGGLRRAPWGCATDLNIDAPIASFDTAPYQISARAYSPQFVRSLAQYGAKFDRFWHGLTQQDEKIAIQEIDVAKRFFFLRYQPMALDLVRNHCGQQILQVLRSSGRGILENGIPEITLPDQVMLGADELKVRKDDLLERGICVGSNGALRIPPALVNHLAPRLERVKQFTIKLTNSLEIGELQLDTKIINDSILSPQSGRELVYHLALSIGALSEEEYRHLLRTTPLNPKYPMHFAECLVATDVARFEALYNPNPVTYDSDQSRLVLQETALQRLDALRACGRDSVTLWANLGARLEAGEITEAQVLKNQLGTIHPRVLDLFAFNCHASELRAIEICEMVSVPHLMPPSREGRIALDPYLPRTDSDYSAPRGSVYQYARALHRLEVQESEPAKALFSKLCELTDEKMGPDDYTRLRDGIPEQGGATYGVVREDLEQLTVIRRNIGDNWRGAASAPVRDLHLGRGKNMKPHQAIFELNYTSEILKELQRVSVPAQLDFCKFVSWLGSRSIREVQLAPGGVLSFVTDSSGELELFTFNHRVTREICVAFERGRIIAQEMAIAATLAAGQLEYLRNFPPTGDRARLERELQNVHEGTSDFQRVANRVGAFGRAFSRSQRLFSEFELTLGHEATRPGYQMHRRAVTEFTLLQTREVARSFVEEAQHCHRLLSPQEPYQALGKDALTGAQVLPLLVEIGREELAIMRAAGKYWLKFDATVSLREVADRSVWITNLDKPADEVLGRFNLGESLQSQLMESFQALHSDSEGQLTFIQNISEDGVALSASPDSVLSRIERPTTSSNERIRVQESIYIHAACRILGKMDDQQFKRLLTCSFDSGTRYRLTRPRLD